MRMRTVLLTASVLLANAATLSAQEHGEAAAGGGGLMSLQVNLMFWTLIIFIVLAFLLAKFAFPVILGAVQAREKALEDAIQAARADREEATRLLAEHRAKIEAARDEAQKLIAEGRVTSERMRAELLEQTQREQGDMLERARREIGTERDRAIMQLRREAVDLAIAGAGKVIEANLDAAKNRKLVEDYLNSLGTIEVSA